MSIIRHSLLYVGPKGELPDEFPIVPGLSEEAIIGAETLQKWRIKLDFEHDQVLVDPKVARLQLI